MSQPDTAHNKNKATLCPCCQTKAPEVREKTILQHLKTPWHFNAEAPFFFCSNKQCELAYFNLNELSIKAADLRTALFTDQVQKDPIMCFCFNISLNQLKEEPSLKAFIVQETKQKNCTCSTANPSGRCCLNDISSTFEALQ